jgi:hypothetical protein
MHYDASMHLPDFVATIPLAVWAVVLNLQDIAVNLQLQSGRPGVRPREQYNAS